MNAAVGSCLPPLILSAHRAERWRRAVHVVLRPGPGRSLARSGRGCRATSTSQARFGTSPNWRPRWLARPSGRRCRRCSACSHNDYTMRCDLSFALAGQRLCGEVLVKVVCVPKLHCVFTMTSMFWICMRRIRGESILSKRHYELSKCKIRRRLWTSGMNWKPYSGGREEVDEFFTNFTEKSVQEY